MAAIGFDLIGIEEFVEGEFFDGELYTDEAKLTYKDLGFKRYTPTTMVSSLTSPSVREARARNARENIPSNLTKGDPLQNGGTLVVKRTSQGPRLVLSFKQENLVEHVSTTAVLKALGITPPEGDSPARATRGKKGPPTNPVDPSSLSGVS